MPAASALVVLTLLTGTPGTVPTAPGEAPAFPAIGTPVLPGARPEDVGSLDAILAALYEVISGPAGQRRDWDRMRALFVPGARLIPAIYRPDSVPGLRIWDLEQYISQVGPRLESAGFFEREIARRIERYGGMTHVFSTYESRRTISDPAPFARGINSIQVFFDGRRWWLVTIFWEGERPDNPIPGPYLQTLSP